MPIYRPLNAIQVHVPKTAGQSVEAALGCSYLPEDLYGLDGDVELSHLTAAEIRRCVPAAWAASYRFGFVRNPWARAVSAYHFCRGRPLFAGGELMEFAPYVERLAALDAAALARMPHVWSRHLLPQVDYLCDAGGTPVVDFVGRFEEFERDLRAVCARLGVVVDAVPHVNASEHRPYRDYYTPASREALAARYATDVVVFDYRFDR